jgi:tetratricopeptide (TPR) repeat protein
MRQCEVLTLSPFTGIIEKTLWEQAVRGFLLIGAVLIFTAGGILGAQDAEFFIQRAREYTAQFNRDKAFENYDSALSVEPNNIRALNGRGAIYVQKGEYPKARMDFEKAYGINKDDAETRHNLQFIYDFYRKNPDLMNAKAPQPATEPEPFKTSGTTQADSAAAAFYLNTSAYKPIEQIYDYPKSAPDTEDKPAADVAANVSPPPPDAAPPVIPPQSVYAAQVPQVMPQSQVPQAPVPAPQSDESASGIVRKTVYPEVQLPQINGSFAAREGLAPQAPAVAPSAVPSPAPLVVRSVAVSVRLNADGDRNPLPAETAPAVSPPAVSPPAVPPPAVPPPALQTISSSAQSEGVSVSTAVEVVTAAEAVNNTGVQLNRTGNYEKAIEQFTSAISYNPGFAIAYNNRGAAYFFIGEYEKAFADFNKALLLNPYYFDAHANREQVKITLASK